MNDLTDRERYFLLKFSYIDISKSAIENPALPRTISETWKYALEVNKNDKKATATITALQNEYTDILKTSESLRDVKIIGYDNLNATRKTSGEVSTGFVGYALQDSNGNRGFLYRGSEFEDTDNFLAGLKDWTDNLISGTTGDSRQIEQANAFFDKYAMDDQGNPLSDKTFSIYGHSKGNNLGAEVFLNNLDKDIYAYSVNGQPVFWYDLSDQQKEALRGDRYEFVVHEGDFVSEIGHVDYLDKVVKTKPGTDSFMGPHSPGSVEFDASGMLVNARKPTAADQWLQADLVTAAGIMLPNNLLTGIATILGMVAVKRYAYVVIDSVKLTIATVKEGLMDLAATVKESCTAFLAKVNQWSRSQIDSMSHWFDGVIAKAAGWFAAGRQTADRWFGITEDDSLSVDLMRLNHYAERLSSLSRQVADINDVIDSLYRRISLLDLGHLLTADCLTGTGQLDRCAEYMNSSRERLQSMESRISQQAASF